MSHGNPQPIASFTPPAQPGNAAGWRRRPGTRMGRRIVLAVLIALSIPIMIVETPREIARWHEATAKEKYLNGNRQAALASLEKSLQWDSKSVSVYIKQAGWKRESGDLKGSLIACNRAIALKPSPEKSIVAHMQRSSTYQAMQDTQHHRAAVDDWNAILQLNKKVKGHKQNRARFLNGLSYTRAVGNLDLKKALQNVQESLEGTAKEPDVHYAMGFLHYWLDDMNSARLEFDRAVELIEQEYRDFQKKSRPPKKNKKETKVYKKKHDEVKYRVALMHVQRGLLLRKLTFIEDAKKDEKRAKELGENVEELKNKLPSEEMALSIVANRARRLDTRGYVYFRLRQWKAARRDLEESVKLGEILHAAWKVYAPKTAPDLREVKLQAKEIENSLAVMYYHRALVHEKIGKQKEAEADFQRVIDLGYEPGDALN